MLLRKKAPDLKGLALMADAARLATVDNKLESYWSINIKAGVSPRVSELSRRSKRGQGKISGAGAD